MQLQFKLKLNFEVAATIKEGLLMAKCKVFFLNNSFNPGKLSLCCLIPDFTATIKRGTGNGKAFLQSKNTVSIQALLPIKNNC